VELTVHLNSCYDLFQYLHHCVTGLTLPLLFISLRVVNYFNIESIRRPNYFINWTFTTPIYFLSTKSDFNMLGILVVFYNNQTALPFKLECTCNHLQILLLWKTILNPDEGYFYICASHFTESRISIHNITYRPSVCQTWYSQTYPNQTSLAPTFVFGIDRFIQVKLTKISCIKTIFKVWFIKSLV
jgi:hypothetical protein